MKVYFVIILVFYCKFNLLLLMCLWDCSISSKLCGHVTEESPTYLSHILVSVQMMQELLAKKKKKECHSVRIDIENALCTNHTAISYTV